MKKYLLFVIVAFCAISINAQYKVKFCDTPVFGADIATLGMRLLDNGFEYCCTDGQLLLYTVIDDDIDISVMITPFKMSELIEAIKISFNNLSLSKAKKYYSVLEQEIKIKYPGITWITDTDNLIDPTGVSEFIMGENKSDGVAIILRRLADGADWRVTIDYLNDRDRFPDKQSVIVEYE